MTSRGQIPEAPTFWPSEEQFQDPLKYIEAIRSEAEPYGICRVVPPEGWSMPCHVDWASQERFPTKRQRVDKLRASQPYGDGRQFTLREYKIMTDEYLRLWLQAKHPDKTLRGQALLAVLESDYLDILDGTAGPGAVEVEYGNDVDVHKFWSGFPKPDIATRDLSVAILDGIAFGSPEYYMRSGWNLNNIASWPGSLLRHIIAPLPGVTSPWLYLGMLFSTFSWHNEDNYLSSINYHHVGAPKQWYGIPGDKSGAFEKAAQELCKHQFQKVADPLHHMNTMFSPLQLAVMDVPVYRLCQAPGEFVITFPQAYHGGFSYGFNCGEAVNFAMPHWIEHANLANERYRRIGRLAVLSHDRLMFTLARHCDEFDDSASCQQLRKELKRIMREELVLRPQLYAEGVRRHSTRMRPSREDYTEVIDAVAFEEDDTRICAVCKHTCFLSAVACNCSQTQVCCLRHISYNCECPSTNKFFIDSYDFDQFDAAIVEVEKRLAMLPVASVPEHAQTQE
eukprot:CAMPEP_0119266428 /NCGR_PEP_ID=MMETSP1329-20130426/4916_1 /TAXON_ID=114041 /ORGANISM="Genus nov. species nov., Strain RCC1024" /LENGTH=507 /DNA_ID=CAMNT_0007266307 /DNA_START=264 /DNA_END=1787 /DNA_ORIENTATION=+